MKVNIQTNDYECGICVLKSIYEYSYKKEIKKEHIIENYHLTKNGISIYDFEILASKIGLNIESYNIEYEDLINLNYSDFFITCLNNGVSEHFVICKFKKNKIELYDSCKGQYDICLDEFQKLYNSIFIIFSKKILDEIEKNKTVVNSKFFDFPNEIWFSFLTVSLDLILLFFALLGSCLIKLCINFMQDNIYSNLIYICIYFVLIFILENIFLYSQNLIKVRKLEQLNKRNIVYYINYLSKKTKMFFKNTPKHIIYQYPICIGKVLEYKYINKPGLVSNSIFLLIITTIIFLASFKFLFFVLIYSSLSIFCSYILRKYNDKNYANNNYLKNEFEYNFNNLYTFLENEKYINKLNKITKKCKYNYWQISKQNIKNVDFCSNNNFFKMILKKLFFALIIILSILEIMKTKNNNISQLLFLLTLLNLFDNTCMNIFSIFSSFPEYKKSKNLLNEFLNSYNKNFDSDANIEINYFKKIKIKNLTFSYTNNENIFYELNFELKNNTLIKGRNGSGKTTLFKIISLDLPINKETEIYFNDTNLSNCNLEILDKNICYIPSQTVPYELDFSLILNMNEHIQDKIINFIKITKISSKQLNELSSGEIQLTNLLSLLTLKNNLILLDETFSNLSDEYLDIFMNDFYPTIVKNNFVLVCSHNKNIEKYFSAIKEI